MEDRDLNLGKKKRGRPAVGRGEQLNVMLRSEIVRAIDEAASVQDDAPARSEMARRIIREWLIGHGYLTE